MDAISISFTTKEGVHVVAYGEINKKGDRRASVDVWNLADNRDDDYCPDNTYIKSDLDVYTETNQTPEKLDKLDKIIFKRVQEDLLYFKQELEKIGLSLAEQEFDPCNNCESTEKRENCYKDFTEKDETELREYRPATD
jgi:hypothetical protein